MSRCRASSPSALLARRAFLLAAGAIFAAMQRARFASAPSPRGPDRLRRLQDNIPRVEALYRQAIARR